ncbi:hypothetical protein PHLCEN_2v9164 [Hermanssonia centrifuga]|uniref:Endonuclease/exonuclease/phosphatase domain-containing protein n=1 Tax=Hermanssonia centrifuga TaxID=98765 RepID=A0A2R6NRM2_9APHY|nr:hypothetical protein PHLCEN_2v9164 [Hermanssonia centrifuga]
MARKRASSTSVMPPSPRPEEPAETATVTTRTTTKRPAEKHAASSSKRKATTAGDESDSGPLRATKKAKSSETGETSANAQPTNKVLPVHIEFPPKASGSWRIATWNICGLAASSKKGFKFYVEAEDADILVLTETKVNNDPADPLLTQRYPHRYWSIAEKKSYSGTAILSKIKPLSVDYTLPGHPDPKSVKGRIVTLEFKSLYLVGTYVVNAGTGLKTLDAKKEWNVHFEKYIRDLDKKKPVIWTGDLNVAPTAIGRVKPPNDLTPCLIPYAHSHTPIRPYQSQTQLEQDPGVHRS